MLRRTSRRSAATSKPATRRPAAVRRDQRREDPHGRRLARAVGPEQREHRSRAPRAGRRRPAPARRRRTSRGPPPRPPARRHVAAPDRVSLLRMSYALLRKVYAIWADASRRPTAGEHRGGVGRRAPRRAKGPKPGLSLERIVAAAIAIADAEGLEAVSMNRVAKRARLRRDVAVSLRRVQGGAARADGRRGASGPCPSARDEDWRARLRAGRGAPCDAMRAHPWRPRVPIAAPPLAPNPSPGSRTRCRHCATPASPRPRSRRSCCCSAATCATR